MDPDQINEARNKLNVQNTSGKVAAGTVQTTLTVSSEQTDGGDLNVASGTDAPASKSK